LEDEQGKRRFLERAPGERVGGAEIPTLTPKTPSCAQSGEKKKGYKRRGIT